MDEQIKFRTSQCKDVKSFVDDLSLGQGVVLSKEVLVILYENKQKKSKS